MCAVPNNAQVFVHTVQPKSGGYAWDVLTVSSAPPEFKSPNSNHLLSVKFFLVFACSRCNSLLCYSPCLASCRRRRCLRMHVPYFLLRGCSFTCSPHIYSPVCCLFSQCKLHDILLFQLVLQKSALIRPALQRRRLRPCRLGAPGLTTPPVKYWSLRSQFVRSPLGSPNCQCRIGKCTASGRSRGMLFGLSQCSCASLNVSSFFG